MDHLRTVGLQLLDHVLACQQPRLLLVQCLDLGDLPVEGGDLGRQVVVALPLAVDLRALPADDDECQHDRATRGPRQPQQEFLLALIAPFLSPGQQVEPGHQSKLLRARPQAIISAGASWARACACTRGPRVMCASGLAETVGTPSWASTISATFGIDAQPPASTIRSTRLNSLPA